MTTSPVRTDTGAGNLDRLVLEHASGSKAELYLFGAHVTSWQPQGQPDVFFVSRKAIFNATKPIRGGIPVIFPQFGDGPYPKHGFARTQTWRVSDSGVLPGGEVFATLSLEDSEATRALWPFRFHAELRVELSDRLKVTAKVLNRDSAEFPFQFALHTYFTVADIRRTAVLGLKGTRLSDSLVNDAESVEDREAIGFAEEVDRVYMKTGNELAIRDEAGRRTLRIQKECMPDVVVWNPWIERSLSFADLAPDDYRGMVCVETGCIADPIRLRPGETWEGSTSFHV